MKGKPFKLLAILASLALISGCATKKSSEQPGEESRQSSSVVPPQSSETVPPSETEVPPSSTDSSTEPVDPTIHPSSIAFAESEISLELGESKVVGVTVLPAEADDKSFTVVSDHPEFATYDADTGTVRAVGKGTAVLTATTVDGGLTATLTVHVTGIAPQSIAFAESEISLELGESKVVGVTVLPAEADDKSFTVVSDHPEFATYDVDTGTVRAVGKGTAVLTATTVDGGLTGTLTVHVTRITPKSITFPDASISIMAGTCVSYEATVLPADAEDKSYTITSDDPEIAYYDTGDNTIVALKAGNAVLTATTTDGGLTASVEVVVTPNIHDIDGWSATYADEDYFLDEDVIVSDVEDENFADGAAHYNFDEPHFLLRDEAVSAGERGLNYTISLQFYSETEYPSNQVTAEIDAGAVVWYQDADNFLTVGAKWANWDRPHEVRSIYLAGKIGGSNVNASDSWTDNCGVDPYLFHSLEITKVHNSFSFKAYRTNEARVKNETPFKTGQFNVTGIVEASSCQVGLYGVNDAFRFSNFSVVSNTVSPSVDQQTYTNAEKGNLVLDTWFHTYTLGTETGTYTQEGLLLTLTPESGEPYEVDITMGNPGTWEIHNDIPDTDPQFELDGRSGEVQEMAFEGISEPNYKVEFDIYGTAASAISAKVGLYTRYVDASNFSNVYVEWSASERPGQIRCVQVHNWNGSSDSWNDIWCDWDNNGHVDINTLFTSNGYHMILTKVGDKYTVDLASLAGDFHKTDTKTLPASYGSYDVKWFAAGDKFTIKNATFDFSGNYDITGEVEVIDHPTNVVVHDGGFAAHTGQPYENAHTIDVDVHGTIMTDVTNEVNCEFAPWYVDENNYLFVSIQWRNWDRAKEIRSIVIHGKMNGEAFNLGDNWTDNCGIRPMAEMHIKAEIGASSSVITVSSGTWSKVINVNKALNLDVYVVAYQAQNDTFSFSGLTVA